MKRLKYEHLYVASALLTIVVDKLINTWIGTNLIFYTNFYSEEEPVSNGVFLF